VKSITRIIAATRALSIHAQRAEDVPVRNAVFVRTAVAMVIGRTRFRSAGGGDATEPSGTDRSGVG
jgi:hypothetical protein